MSDFIPPEVTEAELDALRGDYRSKPFRAAQARLATLGARYCGGHDRDGHVAALDEFVPKSGLCASCRASSKAASTAARLANETLDDYLDRRARENERAATWRSANPEKIAKYVKHQRKLRRIRHLLRLADEYGAMVKAGEELWAQYLALVETGKAAVEADPSILDGFRPLTRGAYESDASWLDTQQYFFARRAPGLTGRDASRIVEAARKYVDKFSGRVRRYVSKAERMRTGLASIDKHPSEHLIDVLESLRVVRPEDLEAASQLGDEPDDGYCYALAPKMQALLDEEVRRVRAQCVREWKAKSPEERAAIEAQRADFLRSLRLMNDEDFDEMYERQREEFFENAERIERGVVEHHTVHSHNPDAPHPDALKLTDEELAELGILSLEHHPEARNG